MRQFEKPEDQDFEQDDPGLRWVVPAQDLDFEEDDAYHAW